MDDESTVLPGEFFNQLYPDKTFVIVIKGYELGDVVIGKNHTPMSDVGNYLSGGYTVTILDNILNALPYEITKATNCFVLTVDDDAIVYIENEKIRTDKITVTERRDLFDLDCWEDDDFCKMVIAKNSFLKKYIRTKLTEEQEEQLLKKVKKDPTEIQKVVNPTADVCIKAFDINPETFHYMDNPQTAVKIHAVIQNPDNYSKVGSMLNYAWIEVMQKHYSIVKHTGLQNDQLVAAALKVNGLALRLLPAHKKTEEFYKLAVTTTPALLADVPSHWRTYEMCLAAVTKDHSAIEFVPSSIQTEEICMIAVTDSGKMIKHAKFITQNVYDEARRTYSGAKAYKSSIKSEDSEEFILAAIKKDPTYIKKVKEPSRAAIFESCRFRPDLIMFVVKKELLTDHLCIDLIKANPKILEHIMLRREVTDEMYRQALSHDGSYLQCIVKKTDNDCWCAVQNSPDNLQFVEQLQQSMYLVNNAVSRKGTALQYVIDKKIDTCVLALQNDPMAIHFVPVDMVTEEMWIVVIIMDPMMLLQAKAPTMNMWLTAIQKNPRMLSHCSQQTDELCLRAVEINGDALEFVKFQTMEIKMAAIKKYPYAVRFAKPLTKELWMYAIRLEPKVLGYIPNQTVEMCLYAISKDRSSINLFQDKSKELAIFAVIVNPYVLESIEDVEVRKACLEFFSHFMAMK